MLKTPIFGVTRVTSDVAVSGEGGHRVVGVLLVAAAAAATLALHDAASATGTPLLNLDVPANDSYFLDLSSVGGVLFPDTGIFADIGGASAVAYIWVD